MSKKLGKILLISASIATVSIAAAIIYKRLSDKSIVNNKVNNEDSEAPSYITIKSFTDSTDNDDDTNE